MLDQFLWGHLSRVCDISCFLAALRVKIAICPASQKLLAYMEKNVNLHWISSKGSLALQPEALVNTSRRVDFSSPGVAVSNLTGGTVLCP